MLHELQPIDVVCPEFGELTFIGRSLFDGHDRLIRANCARDGLEALVFLDSRGICADFSGSLGERILKYLDGSRGYLAVFRPLELTTWATLFNFLASNALRPKQIITNMGFVDFTPKKRAILVDAIQQVEARMGAGVAHARFVEQYPGEPGESLELYAMSYDARYRERIESMIAGIPTVVINTPIVPADIRVPRRRPSSFFAALELTTEFNRSIRGATVVDLPVFDESYTYDGVHYTNLGNELVFSRVKQFL
jgi:hypothetical protein